MLISPVLPLVQHFHLDCLPTHHFHIVQQPCELLQVLSQALQSTQFERYEITVHLGLTLLHITVKDVLNESSIYAEISFHPCMAGSFNTN